MQRPLLHRSVCTLKEKVLSESPARITFQILCAINGFSIKQEGMFNLIISLGS